MKNFHLPLPEQTYDNLRAVAERMQVPATTLAREAVDCWLRQQFRKSRREAIAAYAAEMAGTHLDLDPDLESAAIEHLVKGGKPGRWAEVTFTGPIWFRDQDRNRRAVVP
jgi:hypothetical protein